MVSMAHGGRMPLVVAVTVAAVLVNGAGVTARAAGRSDAQTAGIITTVAGGVGGPGPATDVAIDLPCSVTSAGRFLYVGSGLVEKVDEASGFLTTPAGGVRRDALVREHLPPGNGGPADEAATDACGTSVDGAGNLVLADGLNRFVRVVAGKSGTFYGQAMTAGHIYAVAGTGNGPGITGNGGPATQAGLSDPVAVTVDKAGNLVIADSGSGANRVGSEVQVVAERNGVFYGQQMTAGDIYAVAGKAAGVAVSGDGGPAVKAGLGPSIGQIQLDSAGNLVLADASGNNVRVVAESSGTFYGRQMTARDIYAVAGDGTQGFSGDGGPALQAKLAAPSGVTVDGAGNLVIADTGNNRIRVAAARDGTFYGVAMTARDIYTVAGCGANCPIGDGGSARRARIIAPDGVAVDGAGNLVVSERGQGRISSDRRVRAVAASGGTFYGQKMTVGDIYTIVGDGTRGLADNGGLATRATMISLSSKLAFDKAGNMVIPAGQNNRVRVVPATSGTFYGVPMVARHIYVVAGGGHFPYSGDGGPARQAGLNFLDGMAIDAHGTVLLADEGNRRIRAVAARTGTFYGIRMTANDIYTVAGNGTRGFSGDGGPATKAELNVVEGLAVDSAGNIVLTDRVANRVRVVAASTGTFYGIRMTANHIYTVAGNGTRGFSGDGGPATKAAMNQPVDATFDGHGNLVIADMDNNRVRVVAATPGIHYGVPMAAGDIYTVAGNGQPGYSGDGGPATKAQLLSPTGVAVNVQGNLFVADYYRVRMITG